VSSARETTSALNGERYDVLLVGGLAADAAVFEASRVPIGHLPKPIDVQALEREIARALSAGAATASTGEIRQ